MIDTHEEYEAALEKALALLAEPPEPGCRDHEAFLALLHEIEQYHDQVEVVADHDPFAKERAELSQRLAAYTDRYRDDERVARQHREGEGIRAAPFII